uniref:Pentraxin (PTX) domain-containing protein n=1 Tax=Oryzias latipes TaxID=8090 RepID=A0A3P9IEP3_ORYLA
MEASLCLLPLVTPRASAASPPVKSRYLLHRSPDFSTSDTTESHHLAVDAPEPAAFIATALLNPFATYASASPCLLPGFKIQPNVRNAGVRYGGRNYKPNMWYSNCSTWDSATGLVQIWFDGKPSFRKYIISGAITQTQDSHGGGFNINQSFVGMMSDVHMWNYTLSPCEIQNYMNKGSFTPGNVLNWKALNFQINGRVLIENIGQFQIPNMLSKYLRACQKHTKKT